MKQLIAVAVVPLLMACGANRGEPSVQQAPTESAGVSPETFAIGTELTPAGGVAKDATAESFARGGEIYVSVDVASASTDQLVEVQWVDPNGSVVRHDKQKVPQEARYVAFSSGPTSEWTRGSHQARVVIDGRAVAEKQFSIL